MQRMSTALGRYNATELICNYRRFKVYNLDESGMSGLTREMIIWDFLKLELST